MNLARLVFRSIRRNRTRFVLTAFGAAIAVLSFVLLRTLLGAWSHGAEHAAKDRLATRHRVSLVMPLPRHYVEDARQVPGVNAVTWATWFGGKDPRNPDLFFANEAVDPASFLAVYDEVELAPEARAAWLENRRGAIIGDVLAKTLKMKVGDTLTLEGTIYPGQWPLEIVGIYRSNRRSFDRSQLLFRWDYWNDTVDAKFKNQIGWITSRVNDPAAAPALSKSLDAHFANRDIQTATMSERALQTSFLASASAILSALQAVSFILLGIMALILGNTMAMGVRERTHEYGVLLALGFSPSHIVMCIFGEAIFLGLIAGGLGVALSFPMVQEGIGRWLEENMGNFLPYVRIGAATAVAAILLAVGVSLLGSLIPAVRASRLVVTDALKRVA
jgi:putative ABC transport system permease protein